MGFDYSSSENDYINNLKIPKINTNLSNKH